MNIKKIIQIHLLLTVLAGYLVGIFSYVTDSTDSVRLPIVIPGGMVVMSIAYGGPVILGLLVLSVMQKKNPVISPRDYLASYYLLLIGLVVSVVLLTREKPESGFALFLIPWLPIPALVLGVLLSISRIKQ